MLPNFPRDHAVFHLGVLLTLAALIIALLRHRKLLPAPDHTTNPTWPTAALVLLAAALLANTLFRQGATFLIGGDEYYRADFAIRWAEKPYFATPDHVWLPGQFYILGTLFRITHDIKFAVALTSLAGYLLTIHFTASIAYRLWRDSRAAALTGILTATHWVILWCSINPVAEAFFFPCLMAALDRWVAAWQHHDTHRRDRHLLIAAILTALGTTFRFEMWYAGILLGTFLLTRALIAFLRGNKPTAARSLAAAAIIALYPIAYLISSALHFGSPLAFLHNASDMNNETNLFYDFSTPLRRLFIYPIVLWQDHWYLLPLPLAGVAIALTSEHRRRMTPMLAATAALLLFAMLISMKSGIGSNTRARYTLFLLLPIITFAAGPLSHLIQTPTRRLRHLIPIATITAVLLTVAHSFDKARDWYTHAFKVSPPILELMTRLERENDASRAGLDYYHLQIPYKNIEFHTPTTDLPHIMARYHAADGRRIKTLTTPADLEKRLLKASHRTRFLVDKPFPPITLPPRAVHVEDQGPFEVWVVRD